MAFIDAALAVLREARRPLTAREVTDLATAKGLLHTAGKTPDATMSAALYAEANGPAPRVRKVAQQGPVRAVRGSVRWVVVP